jgi:hypothetical protein
MDAYVPDLSRFWNADSEGARGRTGAAKSPEPAGPDESAEEQALKALADRVNAARAIV